jgi:hypothetical protein
MAQTGPADFAMCHIWVTRRRRETRLERISVVVNDIPSTNSALSFLAKTGIQYPKNKRCGVLDLAFVRMTPRERFDAIEKLKAGPP